MDIMIILQIITIAISVLSMGLALITTLRENSKNNFLKYTTQQRLKDMCDVRRIIANIITLSSPLSIREVIAGKEKSYIRTLIQASSELEMIFKSIYEEEQEIILLVGQLVAKAILFYKSNDVNVGKEIENDIIELKNLFSIYDTANWEFIKAQTKGKFSDNNEFLILYDKYMKAFSKKHNISSTNEEHK